MDIIACTFFLLLALILMIIPGCIEQAKICAICAVAFALLAQRFTLVDIHNRWAALVRNRGNTGQPESVD